MALALVDLEKHKNAATYAAFLRYQMVEHFALPTEGSALPQHLVEDLANQCNAYWAFHDLPPVAFPRQISEAQWDAMLPLFSHQKLMQVEHHVYHTGVDAERRCVDAQEMRMLGGVIDAALALQTHRQPPPSAESQEMHSMHFDAETQGVKEVSQLPKDAPLVLILSGGTVQYDNPTAMRGIGRLVHQMLTVDDAIPKSREGKAPQLVVLTHPKSDLIRFHAEHLRANADPNAFRMPHVDRWVKQTLLPALGETGEALQSPANLKRACGRLRFYSTSYGTIVQLALRNALAAELRERGHAVSTIRDGLAEVFALQAFPTVRLDVPLPETGAFSTLNLVSTQDEASRVRGNYGRLVPPGEQAPTLVPINEQTLLYWKHEPVEGYDMTRFDEESYRRFGTPRKVSEADGIRANYRGHNPVLSASDIVWQDSEGNYQFTDNLPVRNALRNSITSDEVPEDLGALLQGQPKQPYTKRREALYRDLCYDPELRDIMDQMFR